MNRFIARDVERGCETCLGCVVSSLHMCVLGYLNIYWPHLQVSTHLEAVNGSVVDASDLRLETLDLARPIVVRPDHGMH